MAPASPTVQGGLCQLAGPGASWFRSRMGTVGEKPGRVSLPGNTPDALAMAAGIATARRIG